jgi:hypothetical protein
VAFRLTFLLAVQLAGCGGGGSSQMPVAAAPIISQFVADKASYFVGEQAQLHAEFANGTGHVQPGNIAILSGQTITTPVLAASTKFQLTVEGASTSVTRELMLGVSYRERMRATAMPFARARHAAVTMNDGRVLIVGGLNDTTPDPSAEMYDPVTRTFSLLSSSLTVPRYSHTALMAKDGRVFIYGGVSGDGQAAPPELFDPATGTFTKLNVAESNTRANHTAVATSNGTIWIAGGDDGTSALTAVIQFDVVSGALRRALDLATPRTDLAAAALTDGRVLIAGGAADGSLQQITDSSELFDSATALRSASPAMSTPRSLQTMTLLSNGKVLITGGIDQGHHALASAEIFE